MCPKKNGFKRHKMLAIIAISLEKIFLVSKKKPTILKREKIKLMLCFISTIYLLLKILANNLDKTKCNVSYNPGLYGLILQ